MKAIDENWYVKQPPAVQAEFRQWVKEQLQAGPIRVEFLKSNGEIRDMMATLETGVVPLYERKTDKPRKPANVEICSVYDLDKKEWRSFRYDRLVSVRFDTETQKKSK